MIGTRVKVLPIGIDIGTRTLRFLQLVEDNGSFTVHAAAEQAIPINLRRSGERSDFINEAFTDILKNHAFKGREFVTLVPNRAIKFKSFRVPPMPEEELEQVVMFEAQERFAFDGDAEYRYLLAGDVRQGQETKQEIIAMGCPGKDLAEHLALFDQHDLVCRAIDATPGAIGRVFWRAAEEPNEKARIVADIGFHSTRIIIMNGDRVVFAKSIPIGDSHLCEHTAKKLNLSMEEAMELRREVIRIHGDPVAASEHTVDKEFIEVAISAVRPGMEQLAKEIGLCLRYFAVTFRGVRPDELQCVGGGSHDTLLLDTITDITGLRTQLAYPLSRISTIDVFDQDQAREGLMEWSTVAGLAMRMSSMCAEEVAV